MTITETEGQVVDVLLIEDDEGDVLMTREAFDHYKIRNTLHVVTDGEQALEFVRRTGDYAGAPVPGLIMLDLNLPRRGRVRSSMISPGRGAPANSPCRRTNWRACSPSVTTCSSLRIL